MKIGEYIREFEHGRAVRVCDAEPPLLPPLPADPDAGPGVWSAADAVEMQRALSGWLQLHRKMHPGWHRDYVRNNPGTNNPAARVAEGRGRHRRSGRRNTPGEAPDVANPPA